MPKGDKFIALTLYLKNCGDYILRLFDRDREYISPCLFL